MPRRRSIPLPLDPATHLQRRRLIKLFFFVSGVAIFLANTLVLPGVVDSAQQRTVRPSSALQQQKPRKKQKTTSTLEEASQTSTRGIVATEVADFKADTSAYALVIGISSYKNLRPQDQLKFADADAQALSNFLVSDKGGFRQENVTLLVNEQATREEILRELGRLQNISGPSSLVLVFFAGHGVVNKSGQAFLIASDTRADDLLATGIDMVAVNATVQNMRARSVVIMSDACHAAAIANTLNSGSVTNVTAKYFATPSQRGDSSSFIFSAASPTQASHEDASLRHGLFTHFVLKGLDGESDSNSDGLVTSQELFDYVYKTLAAESQRRNLTQVPEYNVAYDRSIPLAITKESGRAKYQQWFKEDSLVARLTASFDEELNENRLTRPVGHSAWDYYERLKNYGGTPAIVVEMKRDELLKRIVSEADRLIEQSPLDPGKWNEASLNLEKAYEMTRDNNLKARQFFCSVMSYSQSGETSRAKNTCDATLDLMESGGVSDPLISVRIGQFYTNLKDWEKARRAYRLAMGTNANETWLTEYADVLAQLKLYDEAETQLRKALRTNPQHQPGLIKLSAILLREPKKDRVAEAHTHITNARQLKPEDLDTEEVFGRVMLAMGETARAIDSLLKVARLRSTGERRDEALLYLSQSYWRADDLDRAVSALHEAELSGSQNLKIFDMLAGLLDERGDVQEAISAAQRAVTLSSDKAENAQREHLVAEYLERSGQLIEAAYKYRDAERLSSDARLRSSWENHARALFLRKGLNQEAGVPRRAPLLEKTLPGQSTPIIIPGGLNALRRLTGITISDVDNISLARVFDACIRDSQLRSRLVRFYSDYPEFSKKTGMRGGALSGILDLPPPGQTTTVGAREALKFFGVNDKKGARDIKPKEFESRRYILEALGGDPAKLQKGELVRINFRDEELPVSEAMEAWVAMVKDGAKNKAEEQLLSFLKDPQAMKLYVAFSLIPEEASRQFRSMLMTRENYSDIPDGLYFAAPYLRFDQQGNLEIPGQRKGELNWQRVLKSQTTLMLLRSLFEKDNGGALYLFCALSSAGEVGDFIARSNSFEQVFRMFNQSAVPSTRQSFDFMDLLRQMRVEKDQIRLPPAVELWRSTKGTGDPVMNILSTMGKISAGQQLLLAKQIAILSLIGRERPDWAADRTIVDLIASEVAANRESQLEVALDLEMSKNQLILYFELIDRLNKLPPAAVRIAAVRSFQAAVELLRSIAKNSALPSSRITDLTDRLLQLDPSANEYGLRLASFMRVELLNANDTATGSEVEAKLIALLADEPPIVVPVRRLTQVAPGTANDLPAASLVLHASQVAQEQMQKFLATQKHTRLSVLFEALIALNDLEKNPSSAESLAKLKESVESFLEAEQAPDPKKKKPKRPVAQEPTLKETLASQALPIERSTIAAIRNRIAPFVGEALLAHVYAFSAGQMPVANDSDHIRKHDFGSSPWSATQVDTSGRISGNVVRLTQALARLPTVSSDFGMQRSALVEATLNSFQLARRQVVTRDGQEFVARTLDLGEDVLALYFQGDRSTVEVLMRLEDFMTQRRALAVKALVERGEIATALREMTLSELYALGKLYLEQRLKTTSLVDLSSEPGALGALGRVISRTQNGTEEGVSDRLRREINQFGMTTTSRNGLSRLELIDPEPYECASNFQDDSRLAERSQDLKLAIARKAHRSGGGPTFPLSAMLGHKIISTTLAQTRKASGGTSPPERDWRSLILAIQALDEKHFTMVVEETAASSYVRSAVRSKWNDPRPADAALRMKP